MTEAPKQGSPAEHPGIELDRVLLTKGVLDSTIADQGGLSRPLISQITNGNRRITAASAFKICRIIGGDPMYWVRRQQEHDLWVKQQKIVEKISEQPEPAVGSH